MSEKETALGRRDATYWQCPTCYDLISTEGQRPDRCPECKEHPEELVEVTVHHV